MTITIEEIKEAFEVAFDGKDNPLEWGFHGDVVGEHPHIVNEDNHDGGSSLAFTSPEMETLVLNLPSLCKMLLDLHAENERLKADSKRLKTNSLSKQVTVIFNGDTMDIIGYSNTVDLFNPSTGETINGVPWSECEVIE